MELDTQKQYNNAEGLARAFLETMNLSKFTVKGITSMTH